MRVRPDESIIEIGTGGELGDYSFHEFRDASEWFVEEAPDGAARWDTLPASHPLSQARRRRNTIAAILPPPIPNLKTPMLARGIIRATLVGVIGASAFGLIGLAVRGGGTGSSSGNQAAIVATVAPVLEPKVAAPAAPPPVQPAQPPEIPTMPPPMAAQVPAAAAPRPVANLPTTPPAAKVTSRARGASARVLAPEEPTPKTTKAAKSSRHSATAHKKVVHKRNVARRNGSERTDPPARRDESSSAPAQQLYD